MCSVLADLSHTSCACLARTQNLVQNSNNNCFNLLGTMNKYGAGAVHSSVNGRLLGDGEIPIHSSVCHHENIGDCRLEHK